jgi:hypothetical protein
MALIRVLPGDELSSNASAEKVTSVFRGNEQHSHLQYIQVRFIDTRQRETTPWAC